MNMQEVLQQIAAVDAEKRVRWLIDLGWAMTVSARAGYPLAQQADSIPHLMAFNEMQHQLFNYLRRSRTEHDWTIESFIEGLRQKAKVSGIEGDFGWALKWSVERLSAVNE
jgi:hypothetical protein